ncbi:alpha/beta fold hydrolase [Streptomyces spectabilis]|uniref:Alpha/beta hydrolase n=1 Tax=Streptomyces spectabilis TaxID=68270 RepID=A0A5P2X1J0_STRST|nr:alpha/beta hydrolase [Streptomyces spectabilis]MBB5101528.1 pimeloyl-ACP methyl ester carboxylesterase [Streptomyces spectabilis]MCI3900717.1 alpha/beta hydrolase [Streptomyces spectabilis]QEV58258.1 alpha/beta hydrolase [Streptomyces spectabilis]GGV11963.1 alpha/beta hydrolase [Streptomyces spectabilis]
MNTFKRTRAAAVAAAAAAVITAAVPVVHADAGPAKSASTQAKPTVVLVHGAFADASGWEQTASQLRHQGFPVQAVSNPLRGLHYDSAYLTGLLKAVKGPKILVGHSYAGAVITNAATKIPDVKALVYVAAFAPDKGEALGGLLEQHHDPAVPALPQQTFQYTRPDGSTGTDVTLDPKKFTAAFAADVPARTARFMAAAQRPIAAEAFGEPAKNAAWKTIPSWALVAKQDKAIAPSLERFMAKRAGARTTEVNSSHAVMVSHPGTVTEIIKRAYRATR